MDAVHRRKSVDPRLQWIPSREASEASEARAFDVEAQAQLADDRRWKSVCKFQVISTHRVDCNW